MYQNHISPDEWSIIEEGFDKDLVKASESIFSLGNGAMGQRANFEEQYSGNSLQGSYIGGVYYPDKTKVGWWKNGYPKYFAKVLNAPSWIGIDVEINGGALDLNTAKVQNFRRELNMKEGYLKRSFIATLDNSIKVKVESIRFLSLELDELGAIKYAVTLLNQAAEVVFKPYIEADVRNQDANWEESFWEPLDSGTEGEFSFVQAKTHRTGFNVVTFMKNFLFVNGKAKGAPPLTAVQTETRIQFTYSQRVEKEETVSLVKYAGYTVSTNHREEELKEAAIEVIQKAETRTFEELLQQQKESWAEIWEMADITIEGDTKAQQAIRFNIFQLNQTYSGKDSRLNIGPKGFTGEKYGGSTYWDTEAYCLPFYMATKDHEIARNLLVYRYNQLDKAIENGEKLGFTGGAALYPMVTMTGEECHNEWEITFEEIHRNGAIAFAIYNYVRYTGDYAYILEKGLEVLIAIARFWKQRANYSKVKKKYVILGVTGPNEYENNVNNNFHTNYIAKWCLDYTREQFEKVKSSYGEDHDRILEKVKLTDGETSAWKEIADQIYFPYSEEDQVYLQQDGFLDKELIPASELSNEERPINQTWSWDRILRSAYIKQADTLQSFYFFEDHFTREELEKHFDFYEPLTVHESSLSPCVHSIQAARLDRMDQAYSLYLRTSRLDLDDYNREVAEGLHITSMAGTWMSVVEGFGGMRVRKGKLHFDPKIPREWDSYSFKINFRGNIIKLNKTQDQLEFRLKGKEELDILVHGRPFRLIPDKTLTV